MIIDEYAFGRIRIDGEEYGSDVIIYPDRVNATWWRKEGHRLDLEDLSEVLKKPPQMLVIGTGYFGRMVVPKKTLDTLHAQGVKTYVAQTPKAVEEFNRLQQEAASVVAALHLTC